jgi:hypothetical protein
LSYLLQYTRRPAPVPRRGGRVCVDERTRLNRPDLYGDAYVRVFVEDTARRTRRRRTLPEPRLRLRIADCTNTIALEFDVTTPELRDNSLYKIDTLLAALHRFRDGLAAEAELYAQRERDRPHAKKGGARCRT